MQSNGDLKAIEKGKLLVQSDRVLAISYLQLSSLIYMTGIVAAAMKKKV